jgi:hypothetical protein
MFAHSDQLSHALPKDSIFSAPSFRISSCFWLMKADAMTQSLNDTARIIRGGEQAVEVLGIAAVLCIGIHCHK